MRPKGKLFALFAVFAAIGLVTASGAFTSVEADRTVTVNVAGDSSALLQLEQTNTNPDYTSTENGQIVINLDQSDLNNNNGDADASGVNANATTKIDAVVNVTNQGTQEVNFSVQDPPGDNNLTVRFYESGSPGNSLSDGKDITVGDTVTVGIEIETGTNTGTFNETVTFTANASTTA